MPQRPVSNDELAAVGRSFGLSPRADNPRLFDGPTDKIDAMKAVVNRMKAGETLDAVLGNKPTQPAKSQEPSTARKFVNKAAELLPAAGAVAFTGLGSSPQLGYAVGQGYRELVQRGSEIVPALRDLWNLDPQYRAAALQAGTGGAGEGLASMVPGARAAIAGYHEMQGGKPYTGAADIALGGLEAATLGQSGTLAALLKSKPAKTAAQIGLSLLGGAGGGIAAREGAKAMGASEDVAGAVERVGQLAGGAAGAVTPLATDRVVSSVKQRAAGATLGGIKGYKLGGYPAGVVGSVAGAISPETAASASKASIVNALERVASGAKASKVVELPASVRANAQELVGDYAALANETGIDYRHVKDPQLSTDYKNAKKYIDAHVAAGETVDPDLVTLYDSLRAETIQRKSQIGVAAHNEAMRTLSDAASQGPKAYDKAWSVLPKRTQKMLVDVDGDLVNQLQSRSRNAGGKLGKPVDDPWFELVNDITSEPATSVEVPPESPGTGYATWTQPVSGTRVSPGAWVSTDAPLVEPSDLSPAPMSAAAIRAQQRGSKLFSPKVGYSLEKIMEARELQDMADKYYAQRGLLGGDIDAAFMQRFKTLAHSVLGEDKRNRYTFETAQTTPTKSTLNGALWNMFSHELPAGTLKRLGFKKD